MNRIQDKLIQMVNCKKYDSGKPRELLIPIIHNILFDDLYNAVQDCNYAIKSTDPVPGTYTPRYIEEVNKDFRILSKLISFVFVKRMEETI